MKIAVLLYEKLTALDAVGPYEVLSRLPGAEVTFVAQQPGPKRTDTGSLALVADAALADLPDPDIVLVPGGPGEALTVGDEVYRWLRQANEETTWTTSVCTGSLILAAAGLLHGVRATTHWLGMERLAELGAVPTQERVVIDGKFVTAAGVSAGIDMALTLVAEVAGPGVAQAVQLGIEYDPHPPFDAGSPSTAPDFAVDLLRSQSRFLVDTR